MSDTELEAAEYVLGQLRGEERTDIQRRLVSDAELRHWVDWWEQRLISLSLHPKPQLPRKEVWKSLESQLFSSHIASNSGELGSEMTGLLGQGASNQSNASNARWLLTMVAGFALMAMTAVTTLYVDSQLGPSREVPTHYASLESGGTLHHVIERYPNGDITSIAVRPAITADSRVLELWAIVGQTPVSLGLLPSNGESRLAAPKAIRKLRGQLTLAVSVEPAGGSPTGLPTGPVVNTAALVERNTNSRVSF